MKLPKIQNIKLIGIILAIVLVFFFSILGFSGMMAALGIILLFTLPIYMILDNFGIDQDEKLVFSFFIGVGVFPSITYWIGFFISFRIAIFISFAILVIAAYLVTRYKNKNA